MAKRPRGIKSMDAKPYQLDSLRHFSYVWALGLGGQTTLGISPCFGKGPCRSDGLGHFVLFGHLVSAR